MRFRPTSILSTILITILFSTNSHSLAQTNSELLTVQLSATAQITPTPQITIDWVNDGTGTAYTVYRRLSTTGIWGAPLVSLGGSATNYVDNTIAVGTAYEYKLIKSGSTTGYGYINTSIELPAVINKGIIILVVEDTYIGNIGFDNAIDQTISDIENDGWVVKRLNVNKNDAVTSVKTFILSIYNQNAGLTKAIYIIGHVPVPYSGLLNPDGHPDHLGAWPTDGYYADVNGTWTDNTVNDNTSAAQARNHNVPGDGKFDQTVIPLCELQIGRVDFANLSSFSETEEELLIKYLNKAHAYKTKEFDAAERALVDDNFTSYAEGFASSGYRNFSTMFTPSNVSNTVDLRTATNSGSYMWSYGCGAGSYTSCSGIGTTANFSSDSLQTIFAILFGSYFGDWDSNNNFLRSAIAQGQTLNSFWAGRPQWQVHHMALGENIGFSSLLTQNNTSNYFVSTLSAFSKWVHISLMGDPTVRMTYVFPPSNLVVTNNNNDAELSWTASPDTILGYNVYRLDANAFSYTKVNTNIVTGTTFTDNTLISGGLITYIVKAVNLKTTASGSYYNQSLGIRNSASFTVGVNEYTSHNLSVYPNPTTGKISIDLGGVKSNLTITLMNSLGQVISTQQHESTDFVSIDLNASKGIYFLQLEMTDGLVTKKIIKE